MADAGHEKTEKMLRTIEKRLDRIYGQALKESQEKLAHYLEVHERKSQEMLGKLNRGEITKSEYEKWAKSEMLTGKKYESLVETLAADYANTDKIAMSIVNGYTPEAYAINRNFAAFQLEQAGVPMGATFTLYDRHTVENLVRGKKVLLPKPRVDIPKDQRWNSQHIRSAITQGVLQGESIPKIAKRLENVVGMDHAAAIRNARTAITGAQNKGRIASYRDARKMGIKVMNEWLATHDGRTRESHLQVEGERVEEGEEFSNGCEYPGDPDGPPEEVYNCRCTLIPYLPDYDDEEVDLKGLSEEDFDEWQEAAGNVNTSVGDLQEPIRPRKTDFENEEDYYLARDAYRAERQAYNEKLDSIVEATVTHGNLSTYEDVLAWAKENGIEISQEALDSISVRSFSAARPALDEMFRRFPEVKSFSFESYDGSVYQTDFRIGVAKEGLLSANGGFNFNAAYFGNGANEYGIKDGLIGIMDERLVFGDGSFSTLVRHEYGHNVQEYIEVQLADKYHYHTDDWRKHYETFADYDKARTAYFAERRQYEAELIQLAGLPGSSGYSNTNTLELFAEGFAEWSSGGESEFGKAFGDFLRRWY